jgi:hypothetical protein
MPWPRKYGLAAPDTGAHRFPDLSVRRDSRSSLAVNLAFELPAPALGERPMPLASRPAIQKAQATLLCI